MDVCQPLCENYFNWVFGNTEGIVVTAHSAVRHGLDDIRNVHHHHQRHFGIHVRILLRIQESVSIAWSRNRLGEFRLIVCLMAFIHEIPRYVLACIEFIYLSIALGLMSVILICSRYTALILKRFHSTFLSLHICIVNLETKKNWIDFWARTLIVLSPKKTLEGFLGGGRIFNE